MHVHDTESLVIGIGSFLMGVAMICWTRFFGQLPKHSPRTRVLSALFWVIAGGCMVFYALGLNPGYYGLGVILALAVVVLWSEVKDGKNK